MSKTLRFWGLLLIISLGYTFLNSDELTAQIPCRTQDSLALVSFAKNSLKDDWTEKWDLSTPVDTWYGVKLNSEGCVTCIDMDGRPDCAISVSTGNGLSGNLDPILSKLDKLEVLLLGNNRISGRIPSPIFTLQNLQIFDIFANELIGPLPANLGSSTDLRILSVAGNNLTGQIPASVGDLKNLTDLFADNNQIIGPLPSSIGKAENLRKVRLHKNLIDGSIPVEFGDLRNLVSLNLAQNMLTGSIPTIIGNLTLLEDLVLESNDLGGNIPTELGNCTALKRMRICHNQLIGPLPKTIEKLTLLELLHANDNQLSGPIPMEIGACLQLNDLQLQHNQLSGEIPRELGFCGNMRKMNFSFNNIIGPLPRALQNMKQLTELLVTDNDLSGPLPEQIAGMTSLRTLRAQNNNIIGPLPSRINELGSLQEANFQNNKIDQEIPDTYGDVPRLRRLYLNNNRLEGCFPPSLMDDCDKDYDFSDNTRLPWEGDLQMFCDGNAQIGAPCSSDPSIPDEEIQADCKCSDFVCSATTIVMDAFLCEDEALTVGANSYAEAGTVTDSLVSSFGCDSIVMINIAKMDIGISTSEAQCSNDASGSVAVNSNWNGNFDYVISDAQGAVVIAELNQSTLPELNDKLEPGFYRMQLKEVDMECAIDTTFEIKALHEPAQDLYIQGVQCAGQSFEINGVTYDENNLNGTEALQTIHGCDSMVIIDLLYLDLEVRHEDVACEGEENGYISGSMSEPGDYEVNIYNSAGTIVHSETTDKDFETTQNLAPGEYDIKVKSAEQDCDYTDNLSLIATHSAIEPVMVEQLLCQNEELTINGETYSEQNPTGTQNLVSKAGCDSVVVVELRYLQLDTQKEDVACDDDETGLISGNMSDKGNFLVTVEDADGNIVYQDLTEQNFSTPSNLKKGTYGLMIESQESGCSYMETVTVNAQHVTPEPVIIEEFLCQGEEVTINGQVYSEDNLTGREELSSSHGCDSLMYILFQLHEKPVAQNDQYDAGTETELLVDILENDLIPNNEDVIVTIIREDKVQDAWVEEGELSIELDENYSGISTIEYELCNTNCEELCTRASLIITSVSEGYDNDILTPNEDGYNDRLVVKGFEEYELIENASINVVNRWGQVVFTSDNYSNDWMGYLNNDHSKPLPEGVYYYHLLYDNGVSIMGSRSLIR